jgi:DNA polymerase III epsilon subunit-like protein
MSGLQYIIIDLESSGLSSTYHEVCEISVIRCDTRSQFTQFIKCEYPERASIDALRITNKTLADLDKGISKEEAVEKLDGFFNKDGLTPAHRCLIAHNSSFDRRMLHALYAKVGKILPVELWACSMALTRAYTKKIGLVKPKVNLTASLELAGIKKLAGAHASEVDSRNTYLLWNDLINNKGMDHLAFIKNIPHVLSPSSEEQGLDPDLLDL